MGWGWGNPFFLTLVGAEICSPKVWFVMFCHYWQKNEHLPTSSQESTVLKEISKMHDPSVLFIFLVGFWSPLHFLMRCVVPVARNGRGSHPVLNVTVCPRSLWVREGAVTGVWPGGNGWGFLPRSRNVACVALAATCRGSERAERRGAVVLKEASPHGRAPFAWLRAPRKVSLPSGSREV